jgi:hypothetical protein
MSKGLNDIVKLLSTTYLGAPKYPVLVERVLDNTFGVIIPLYLPYHPVSLFDPLQLLEVPLLIW